ncbi:DNA-binding protein [Acinetobacter phage vB_Ab4_Hep4]|uniref:DNA-binding protein n=1 Tax=Acinetobacter phage vB_Ab4_Hep4 TaxID=2970326 RepID=A0A976SPK7_9CAUD|nr:DNA-binding protein [Acinetobacter phage vB_Ab4_Hep4]
MKRKNCVAGQCVQVKKKEQTNGWFQEHYRGQFGIIKYLDDDGDVHVEFGDGSQDWGKPHELKKVEGDASQQ